jgi:hypothetical protein
MTKRDDVPLEKNWHHWKEKYEMECRARDTERNELKSQVLMWMQHSITLGQVFAHLLLQGRR